MGEQLDGKDLLESGQRLNPTKRRDLVASVAAGQGARDEFVVANLRLSGVFRLIDWHMMWPVIFIGLGVILLARQSGWGR